MNFATLLTQSEMYVWRSAGYIRKLLVIFGYLPNALDPYYFELVIVRFH